MNSEKVVPYLPQRVLCRVWGYMFRASPSCSPTGRSYKTRMKYMGRPHEDSEQKTVVERLGNKTLRWHQSVVSFPVFIPSSFL